MKSLFVFILLFWGGTVGFAVQNGKLGVLATVNGSPITLSDVLELSGWQETRLPFIYQGEQLNKQLGALRKETLERVIDRKLIFLDFKNKKFKLPKDFEENNLDRIAENYNIDDRDELKTLLESKGIAYSEFKQKAYENAAVDALTYDTCFRNVFITPKQIDDYYKAHKNEFTSPEQVRLQVLMLKTNGIHKDDLATLTKNLTSTLIGKSKENFNNAVLLYSEGPNVREGGDIGLMETSKLRKDFVDAIKSAKPCDIVGPIESPDAYYFIRIDELIPKREKGLKETKKNIEEKLSATQQKSNYNDYVKKLRTKASVQYFD